MVSFFQFEPKYIDSYSGFAKTYFQRTLHDHDSWQLELILDGKANVQFGEESRVATDGDVVIIPPRIPHRFQDLEAKTSCISVKFAMDNIYRYCRALCLKETEAISALKSALITLFKTDRNVTEYDRKVLEHFLKAFVFFYFESINIKKSLYNVAVVEKAKQYIQENAHQPITVRQVAEHINYCANHLSALFRKVENISTKKYIDLTRIEIIRQYLVHSDLSIKEIAFQMGFSDLYSFSRFFKRENRVCPRLFRQGLVPSL